MNLKRYAESMNVQVIMEDACTIALINQQVMSALATKDINLLENIIVKVR